MVYARLLCQFVVSPYEFRSYTHLQLVNFTKLIARALDYVYENEFSPAITTTKWIQQVHAIRTQLLW